MMREIIEDKAAKCRELYEDASFWMMRKWYRTKEFWKGEDPGVDGILVTVGLCIIALVLCVVMQESLETFISTIVDEMTKKATTILTTPTTTTP